jgi:hypothetical protein
MMIKDTEISRCREDYVGAYLTKKQGEGVRQLARTMQGSRAAAVRTAIDAGLRQLVPGYGSSEEFSGP